MSKVHLVQLLCPSRHCFIASAYDEGEKTFGDVVHSIDEAIGLLGMVKQCAICGSTDLRFEDGETRFASLAEAIPHLRALEQENAEARRALDARRASANLN